MSFALPHVADRLFGRPHAIEPVALQLIVEGPAGRRVLAGEPLETAKKGKKSRDFRGDRLAALAGAEMVATKDGLVQYALTPDGIAIIPIAGVLTQKFDWLAAACGWTTYDAVRATLAAAFDDYRVSAIMLDVDSPGGEAAGMLDIADAIMAAGETKPIWAVANPFAASAAYAIAGSASRLVLPRLAQVGSIGCVVIHVDQSASDKAQGLKYTAIYAGAHKVDGWGHAPLSEGARASAQHDVDHVWSEFCALAGRQGRISAAAARDTQAAMFADTDAVAAGLADDVMTFDDALGALAETAKSNRGGNMSTAALKATTALTPPAPGSAAASSAPQAGNAPAPQAMSAPGPGEKCELCGKMMDDDEHVKKSQEAAQAAAIAAATGPSAGAAATAYSVEDATETAGLCQIASAPQLASAFIAAKTPITKVRAALAKRAADAADAAAVDPTSPPAGKAEAAVSAMWDDIVGKINAQNKK